MRVNKTLVLTPVKKDGVVYIEYVANAEPAAERAAIVRRWNTFSAKKCEGKDALGKYYSSQRHAMDVIRAFKKQEKERSEKARAEAS